MQGVRETGPEVYCVREKGHQEARAEEGEQFSVLGRVLLFESLWLGCRRSCMALICSAARGDGKKSKAQVVFA